MKQNVPLPALITTAVVVLGVIGFFIYRATAPAPVSTPDPKVMRDRMVQGQGKIPGAVTSSPQQQNQQNPEMQRRLRR